MTKRIGLFVGREWSFPPAFMEAVSQRNAGVVAEYVLTGALSMTDPVPYDVLIDRISHEVSFYRSYLKHAVLQGVPVINNPFMWTADDKFFGASLITKLGLASPKTMLLPNKDYIPGIKHDESLRNLQFPLDWEGIARNIGMPCILKDAHGGGWKEVHVCRSLEELIARYDQSGLLTMIVQEFIDWDEFVRCLCIGQEDILPGRFRSCHDEFPWVAAVPGRQRLVVTTTPHCTHDDHSWQREDAGVRSQGSGVLTPDLCLLTPGRPRLPL